MITSTITINGAVVDRDALDVVPVSMVMGNCDGPDAFEFSQAGATSPAFLQRSAVVVEIDLGLGGGPQLRFRGRIVDVTPRIDGAPGWHYRAEGGAYLADLVSVSHPQRGIGYLAYNAPPTDEADYDPGLVGLELGEILAEVLTVDAIATELWNAGIEAYTAAPDDPDIGYDTIGGDAPVLKAATVTDLALLTTVPLETVRFAGQRLWSQLQDAVRTYAPTFRLRIRADGTIRCTDTRTLTPRILTVGTDPIRVPELKREAADCATAVRVRGRDEAEGFWFTLVAEDLEEDWTEQEEADWTWADFEAPEAGYAACDITALGTDTVTVEVVDGLDEWPTNYWPGIMAHVTLIEDAASGNITYQITRRIVSNTALTSGGTSVLTLDSALTVGSGYNRCEIVGVAGGSHVHRRYKFASDRQDAASRIIRRFPFPVATGSIGLGIQGATTATTPFGWNVKAASGFNVGQPFPLQFSVYTDPDDNLVKLITAEPTVKPWTLPADLDLGNGAVTKPDDIRVFVPVSKGPLSVRVPPADDLPPWEGRAYTIHGLEFEQIIDLEGWQYVADRARAEAFAQDLLDSLKDPVISGTIEYLGYDADAIEAAGIESIELEAVAAFDDLDDDLVDVPLPVHSVELRWNTSPGNATTFATVINVNTRTFPYHGGRQNEPRGYLDGSSSAMLSDFGQAYGFLSDDTAGG